MEIIKKSTLIVSCILLASAFIPSLASAQETVISTNDSSGVCSASCVQTVRYGHGELALVQVKDANGNIAYAKSVHLPQDVTLVSNSSSAPAPANTGVLHTAGTTQVTSTATTQTYVTKDGTIIVIVTTVTYDSNGNILDVEIQEYRIAGGGTVAK
jgi:hypothetical protein